MILTYIISNSREEAEKIAVELLEKKLVYSVNIIPDIYSLRRDGDEIVKLQRTIVLAKTKSLLFVQIEKYVKEVQTTGSAIVFSMPFSQMSQELWENIQRNTLMA